MTKPSKPLTLGASYPTCALDMAWTNAFDAGECLIDVYKGGSIVWSGVLGKGEESPTFDVLSRDAQVSVDADGILTLSCSDPNYADGFEVDCVPQYDTAGALLRASAITVLYTYGDVGAAYFYDADPGTDLTFTEDGSCTPDPVLSTGHTGVFIGIYASSGG